MENRRQSGGYTFFAEKYAGEALPLKDNNLARILKK